MGNKREAIKPRGLNTVIETFLDGLDASVDGRGWGLEHQKAMETVNRALDSHEELLAAAKFALDVFKEMDQSPGNNGDEIEPIGTLKAAIAKAEGI